MRLIFDGNFENQEVRYDEENQDELRRHIGRNLCRFPPFPQGERACGKDAGKLFGRRVDRTAEKPDIRKATFAEYRDWVIINFLLNCGSCAETVRAIQIRDVDLDGGVVFYRHTKNRKAQVIPLCSPMIAILREYGRYRGGEPTDYLFCTETGTQLTENGLR